MTQNLANLYALMSKTFKDCNLVYSIPASYIQSVTGQTNKVIFVFEEDKSRAKKLSPSKLNIKTEDDLNLTGSPLKDDCRVDCIDVSLDTKFVKTPWSPREECFKGLSLNTARLILCDYKFQKEGQSANGSVWVLCNGSDEKKTVLLEMEFEKSCNTRGIVTYKGTIPTAEVRAQDLLAHHMTIMKDSPKVNAQIDSTYNVKANMSIKVSWTTSSLRSSLNNLKNSDVVLCQTISTEDCSSLTEDFLNQLKILAYIKEDIVRYKESGADNRDPVYRCGRGIEMVDLKTKIYAVMTELSGFFDTDGTSCEIEAVIQRAKERTLTDLTDKLWGLIKCCSSYKDLKQAFIYVFQCAAKCNIVNLPTNDNRLAEIINEVSQQRLAIPCLTGSEPLELLLEIGLEKLFKDYEFMFTESKVCSSKDLRAAYESKPKEVDPTELPINVRKSLRNAINNEATPTPQRKTFLHSNLAAVKKSRDSDVSVGFQNSVFNQEDVETKLARLLQIHFTLEHLLLIQINLNLENVYVQVCDQLLKRSPRMFKAIDDSMVDTIELPMDPHSFMQHLEGKEPHTRKVTLTSQNVFREVQSTFFYSTENIFPSNAAECYQTDDKEMLKDSVYFCWNYTKIKSKRC